MPENLPSQRTLTKADLVERVQDDLGLARKDSADLVDGVLEILKQALERGEKVKISGFGNFTVRQKSARPGRNPQTEQPIVIPKRRVLVFKPSQVLRAALNGGVDVGGDEDGEE